MVSDAGTGLARSIKLLNEARAAAATEPVQVGLEVFHTERERQRVVGRRWARAEKLVEAAAQAEQQVKDAKRRGIDARGAAARARAAWGKAERACDAAVQVEAAVERITAALALFRPDGQRHDRAWAPQQITEALGELAGEAWSTARRVLHDVRTLHHLDWMHDQRAQAVPDPL